MLDNPLIESIKSFFGTELGSKIIEFFSIIPNFFSFIYNIFVSFVDIINIFPFPLNWVLLVAILGFIIKMIILLISHIWELWPGN